MIANLTRGVKTASLHLPADRFQIAGVLSYLGVDRLDDYELPCESQDSSGIMVSLEPTGIAERNIAELCRNEKISLGRLNSGFRSLFKLPYEQQLGVMDRIANQKPEHFDDFRKAIDAATVPSVRQEYCFPLTVNLYTANRWGDYDDDPEEYDGRFAARYEDKIRQSLRVYNRDDGEDMAAYFHGNNTVVAKLRSATWDFKRRGGELYGCVTVETAGQLTAEQEADLKDWITGQNSDGLGEGFEQQEIKNEVIQHMKKFFNSIKNKLGKAFATVKATVESTTGEGYIDTGVKIIIGVVVGGVILAGLYALFNTTIIPTLTEKISGMFNYAG